MDKQEGELIMDDALTELFLSLYSTEDADERERFMRLVRAYASNRDDEGVKSIILKVYNFIQSMPEPEEWLKEKAEMYSEDMTESRWLKEVVTDKKRCWIVNQNKYIWERLRSDMLSVTAENININMSEMGETEKDETAEKYWGKLWRNVCTCDAAVRALEKAVTWDELYDFYKAYIEKKSYLGTAMNKIPAKKQASDEEWRKFYNKYDAMRTDFRDECMKLPNKSRDDFNQYVHSVEIKQSVDDIVWLTLKFIELFEEKKNKKNIKSFSDIEHLAYRLFKENENIRDEYADKYREILIDEFQDTNGLQDALFSSISRDGKNMFMVGDLKQSIYRFRGGDPTIFKNKSRIYASGETGGRRIILSQNFRSRKEVIRSINSLFENVMSDEVGDVDYNDDERLKRESERECYEDGTNLLNAANIRTGYNSELHRIAVIAGENESSDEENTDENLTAEEAEAAFIADKIRELIDSKYQVYVGNGQYRDIEYRDIVVLMRSVRSGGESVRAMLENRAVPAFVQKEEYFERREIKLMLTLISLINNHMQDIPLVAVMRSPIGGFTENELAIIRTHSGGRSFYKAVKRYMFIDENADEKEIVLREKCRGFIADLDRWRGYIKVKSIASLIWTLYEETGFYDFMGALEGGEEAQANLKLLYERAKRYEQSGFKGVFNFIRYIERMENRNDDISGAKLVNESHNVVRIMTIHKSKGLEFPVVFLARTTKKLMLTHSTEENRVMLHKDLGIGVDYYNYEDMYCKKLMFNEYIKDENKREYLSEEMRLLYVALTRAREKLIVTASKVYKNREDYEKQLNEWREKYAEGVIPKSMSKDARSYADWIIPAVENGGKCWSVYDDVLTSAHCDAEEKSNEKEKPLENPEEIRELVKRILEFKYPYPEGGALPAKTSVTAIKEMEDSEHIHEDDPVYMTQKPKFMRKEKLGAQIGTAHHQVMAYIDIDKMRLETDDMYEEFTKNEIARIANEGQIERDIAEDGETVDMICKNVCGFFRSDMGKMVLEAKRVFREKPFEIEISACEYDAALGSEYESEKVVVQGIIDLYYEDKNGDIILVDYKTDRCKTEEEQLSVAQKYKKQLELYERAMEKILKKSVKDKYLYLFSAQSVVKLD
jgi:ATP-dependent helicase/nuclease subunit A